MYDGGKDPTIVNHEVPDHDPHVKVRLSNLNFPQSTRANNEAQLRPSCNLSYTFEDGVGQLDELSRNGEAAGTTKASSRLSQGKQGGA